MSTRLETTIKTMTQAGKGILAADESTTTIGKRLATVGVESTEGSRRRYRELLFTTAGVGEFLYGAILFEETLSQLATDGTPFTQVLEQQGILPGIKVDKGLITLALSDNEKVTQGLDGLQERMADFRHKGAYFAKWRAVYEITDIKPSAQAIETNAELLARYAAICQAEHIVPIVEPEVLIDGPHTLERCYEVSVQVLTAVFEALARHNVALEHIILKPSMVIAGKACEKQSTPEDVAKNTYAVLKQCVPEAVPTINFLSGGQSDEQATLHLQLMNAAYPDKPWQLSYSYGRALQAACLQAWAGQESQFNAGQEALYKRCKLNTAATRGEYLAEMETC